MPVNAEQTAAFAALAKSFTSSFEARDQLANALREHLGVTARDSFWMSDDGIDDVLGPVVIYALARDAYDGNGGGIAKGVATDSFFRATYERTADGYTFGEPVAVRRRTDYVRDSGSDECCDAAEDEAEVPAWLATALALAAKLTKGAGHRYIRRVPKSGGGYRYFYKVSGGAGLGHADEMKVGAKFRVTNGGQDGHFEILGKNENGTLRIKHDESGHESTISPLALRSMLHAEHAQSLTAHREKLVSDIKATDDPKAKARLLAEAGKYEHTRDLAGGESEADERARISAKGRENRERLGLDPAYTKLHNWSFDQSSHSSRVTGTAARTMNVGDREYQLVPQPRPGKPPGFVANVSMPGAAGSLDAKGNPTTTPHVFDTQADAHAAVVAHEKGIADGSVKLPKDQAQPEKKPEPPKERGFVGEKYDPKKSSADVAKELRTTFKTALPKGVKVSVTSRTFSQGSAVDAVINDAPFPVLNPARVQWYEEHGYSKTPPRDGPAAEMYTPEGKALLAQVQTEMDKHNRNNSDSRTDYYDVAFSGNVGVGEALKERDRAAAKAPAATAAAPVDTAAAPSPYFRGHAAEARQHAEDAANLRERYSAMMRKDHDTPETQAAAKRAADAHDTAASAHRAVANGGPASAAFKASEAANLAMGRYLDADSMAQRSRSAALYAEAGVAGAHAGKAEEHTRRAEEHTRAAADAGLKTKEGKAHVDAALRHKEAASAHTRATKDPKSREEANTRSEYAERVSAAAKAPAPGLNEPRKGEVKAAEHDKQKAAHLAAADAFAGAPLGSAGHTLHSDHTAAAKAHDLAAKEWRGYTDEGAKNAASTKARDASARVGAPIGKVKKSMSSITDPERDLAKSLAASHRAASERQPDAGARAAHEAAAQACDAAAAADGTTDYRKALGAAGRIGGLVKAWSNIPDAQRPPFDDFRKSMTQAPPAARLGAIGFRPSNGTGDALGGLSKAVAAARPVVEQPTPVEPEASTYSAQVGAVNGLRKSMGAFYDRVCAGATPARLDIRFPPEAKV